MPFRHWAEGLLGSVMSNSTENNETEFGSEQLIADTEEMGILGTNLLDDEETNITVELSFPSPAPQDFEAKTNFLLTPPSVFDVACFAFVVVVAVASITLGSYRSANAQRLKKRADLVLIQPMDAFSSALVTTVVIFALTVLSWLLGQNSLESSLFWLLEGTSVYELLAPYADDVVTGVEQYHLRVEQLGGDLPQVVVDLSFSSLHVLLMALNVLVMGLYFKSRHWVLQDIIGLSGVVVHLSRCFVGSFQTGCIYLIVFCSQEAFWVYAAPIIFGTTFVEDRCRHMNSAGTIIFPHLKVVDNSGHDLSIFGVGDIVVPGLFIALMLRFDIKRGESRHYFIAAISAYTLGILLTFISTDVCGNLLSTPLLVLVPLCIIIPFLMACFKGDVTELLNYQDFENALHVD